MQASRSYQKVEILYDEQTRNSLVLPSKLDASTLVEFIIEQTLDKKTYIFIDGVNECEDLFDILKSLETIARSKSPIRMFFSSINENGIEAYLQHMPDLHELTLSQKYNTSDIEMLVQANLNTHPRLCHHIPALKEEVTFALTAGAQGM